MREILPSGRQKSTDPVKKARQGSETADLVQAVAKLDDRIELAPRKFVEVFGHGLTNAAFAHVGSEHTR